MKHSETPILYKIEPLEARIAPAMIVNPIFDITAGLGAKGASIDLGTLVDASKTYRIAVELVTNFTPPGALDPGVIVIELFNDKAPLTVANFLNYVNNANKTADYNGMFFHRLVKGFVLQGGGFNATSTTTHIETFPTLHNEFDPTDAERSNLAQTVAMAKVAAEQGGGPHSATSEFFINLADNASNLDSQNGGFTVFGRVTDASMPVVNAIANLQQAGNFPVQNYTSGNPTPGQLIQVVDARVVASAPSNAAGHTFSVTVTDAVTGAPSKLVKAKINAGTGTLDLKYSNKLNGTAKIAVTVTKDGFSETDEFLVTLKPNLIGEIEDDGLAARFVPGDTGTAKLRLINNAGGLAKGKVNVKLFLSESNYSSQTGTDPEGFSLNEMTDILIANLTGISVDIASGKSATVPLKYSVPQTGLEDGKRYRLLALIETPSGSAIQELFTDDNLANHRIDGLPLDSERVLPTYDIAFGSFAGRSKVAVAVKDANGSDVTFSIKGPGSGSVTFENGTMNIVVTGTTAASKLIASTARGVVADLGDLFINTTIGSVAFGNIHLLGDFTASGGAKSIVLGDLGNTDASQPQNNADFTLSIGSFPATGQKLTIKLGSVRDYSLATDMPVAALTASNWLNDALNTSKNTITAPSIGTFSLAGNLEADILVAGTGKLESLNVRGTLFGATIRVFGDIGTVKLGGLSDANLFAGLSAKPSVIGDLNAATQIAAVNISGEISNSIIAASSIGKLSVNTVNSNSGNSKWGIYADSIKSYTRKAGSLKFKALDAPSTPDTIAPNYELVLL